MHETVSLVAVAMWAGALALVSTAARRRDETLRRGLRLSLGYFVLMAPRMFFALFLAGFAADLLPRQMISNWLGAESGIMGIMIASAVGIVIPAGGVVAYPLALAMYKIGIGIPQLVAFLTTWAVFALHRILAWELPFLGSNFVALRLTSAFMLPPLAGLLAALLVSLFPA